MRTSLTAVLLLAAVSTAAAQQPPQFDAKPGCEAGARTGISDKPDAEACLRGELKARDDLKVQWTQFSAADKQRCVAKTHMGGPPSYVEVLTCLELARDVARMRRDNQDTNTGLDTGLRRR